METAPPEIVRRGAAAVNARGSTELTHAPLGKVVKVTVGGNEFKLEANATANAKGLVEAFMRAKGVAA
jgi:hypothetical protein